MYVCSRDRVSVLAGPEELSDYIVVARPRMWTALLIVLLLLLGFLTWCIFGAVEKTFTVSGIVEEDVVRLYLTANEQQSIQGDTTVYIKCNSAYYSGEITLLESTPDSIDDQKERFGHDSYSMFIINREYESWLYYCEITPEGALPAGPVEVTFQTESVHPISFVIQ